MSKSNLRQEDNCLNCGQKVHTRFCSHCGQENKEPYETFGGLLFHFVEDIFHYDGKLFSSIRYLFTKPGFLSAEYLNGRRTTFLHPIRFYLFTSAFFFICLFYLFHPLETYLKKSASTVKKQVAHPTVTFDNQLQNKLNTNPKTYEEYLKEQTKLPLAQRNSDWEITLVKRAYKIGAEYGNTEDLFEALASEMQHKMSTLLFLALPLLAFMLQLVFIRREGYYYMHHGIFVLHMATSLFIVLWLTKIIGVIALAFDISKINSISTWLVVAWTIYYFVSFRNFYQIGWKKAVARFILSAFLQNIVLMVIFLGLIILSYFSL